MIVFALVLSAAICAVAALLPLLLALPGALQSRPAAPAVRHAVVPFSVALCAVWLTAAFIYSKPGLSVKFDGLRLLSVCGLSLLFGGIPCLWRLFVAFTPSRRRIGHACLLLVAALGAECLIFNANFWATRSYTKIDLLDYIAADSPLQREADGSLHFTEESNTLALEGIDTPLYDIALDNLVFHYDGEYPAAQPQLFTIWLTAADEAGSTQDAGGLWSVSPGSVRSQSRMLDFSGAVSAMTLNFRKYDGEYIWYRLDNSVSHIWANAPLPFDFSLPRFGLVSLLLAAGWVLCPGSGLWRLKWRDAPRSVRLGVACVAAILCLSATVAPLADPISSGLATATYNMNNWDGGSRVSFSRHINDWQKEGAAQYGALAHSLLNGRVDLELDPPAGLVAMDNPYDTFARREVAPDAMWDVAYYNGRYYVYFGIIPCLLFQVPFEALTGVQDLPVSVNMIVAAWALILACFGLMSQAVRRWFPDASVAAYLLGSTAMSVGSGCYYLLLRPSIYECAILCGMAFVMLALWQWVKAANLIGTGAGSKRICLHLGLGSLCMALVAGCRPQMVLFAALALPLFWGDYVRGGRLGSKNGKLELLWFLLPVAVVAVGLMHYNRIRFGSVFDFGANYNLTSNDMTRRGMMTGRLGPGLFYSFLALPAVQAVFPYLDSFRPATNMVGRTVSELYYSGSLAACPLLLALPAAPLLKTQLAKRRGLMGWVAVSTAAAVALAALDCEMAGILYRYQMDYLAPLVFAAALCLLCAADALRPRCDTLTLTITKALRLAFALGTLMCLCYNFCLFFTAEPGLYGQNPALYQNISRLVQFWL